MGESTAGIDAGREKVRRWLELARARSEKCFICARIASENGVADGTLQPIRISGIELSVEVQGAHLARCVG